MTARRGFARSYESLPAMVAFAREAFASEQVDATLLQAVDFALEELFTNMVKYSRTSTAEVQVEITGVAGGVEVTLVDSDVEPFDVTKAPDADVGAPIEQRRPGGLGIHLIRRLLDSIDYEYKNETRQSRITFRKTLAEKPPRGAAESRGS